MMTQVDEINEEIRKRKEAMRRLDEEILELKEKQASLANAGFVGRVFRSTNTDGVTKWFVYRKVLSIDEHGFAKCWCIEHRPGNDKPQAGPRTSVLINVSIEHLGWHEAQFFFGKDGSLAHREAEELHYELWRSEVLSIIDTLETCLGESGMKEL